MRIFIINTIFIAVARSLEVTGLKAQQFNKASSSVV